VTDLRERSAATELDELRAEERRLDRSRNPAGFWADYDERLQEVWGPIVEQGLERNVAELDALGYTVIDPGVSDDVIERMRADIFSRAERQWGPGAHDGSAFEGHEKGETPGILVDLAAESAFVEAITNRRVVSLVRYICGNGARYANHAAFFKAKGQPRNLHIDSGWPDPLPEWDHMCNASWLLTDVDVPTDGALSFVPGSHRFRRRPTPADQVHAAQRSVPVLAKAGSVVLFRGSTWHGTPAKETPGIRLHVALFYHRGLPGAAPRPDVSLSDEVLARIPDATRDVLIEPPTLEGAVQLERLLAEGGTVDLATLREDTTYMRAAVSVAQRSRGGGSPYV